MIPAAWKRIDRGLLSAAMLLFVQPVVVLCSILIPEDLLETVPLLALFESVMSVLAIVGPPMGGGLIGYLASARYPRLGLRASLLLVLVSASIMTALYFLAYGFSPAVELVYLYMILAVYLVTFACTLIGAAGAAWMRRRAAGS